MPPLIGITTCTSAATTGPAPVPRFHINQAYCHAIAAAGGIVVAVPLFDDRRQLKAIYSCLDGLLISGGADVEPSWYGAKPHPKLGPDDHLKDQAEIRLTKWALQAGLPILAICRGQQVVNVALGGTLYQDIDDELPERQPNISHSADQRPRDLLAHDITIEQNSKLHQLLQADHLKVNSLHHQAVREVAPGLTVTAHAADGVIEAIEHQNHPFFMAVQFHPEELYQQDERMQRLFFALVEAALGGNHGR